ncbi:cytochrome P450 [Actinophytocola sediminis]
MPFLNIVDPEFDFVAPEVMAAQASSWYAESPIGGLVLRYAEGRALLRDQRFDHNGKLYLERSGVVDGPVYDWFVPMLINLDGPDHRRLRGLVGSAFTPRMIDDLRPFIRARVDQLTEELADGGVRDFVEEFGDPLPLAVMCELLGVPTADYEIFRGWTTEVGLVFSIAHGGDIPARVAAALVGLNDYVSSLMADKRKTPGEDLISALVAAAAADDSLASEEELRNLIVTLVFAAHDTTRHQLANAMVTFAEHPGQWAVLGARPELTAQAVEEVMRWQPSTTIAYRFATQDLEFAGLRLARDDVLTVCVATAQRDPMAFDDGGTFDITVPRAAAPLQFGAGPHHCLGAALARAEISEALPVLAARLGPPAIAGECVWGPPMGIHGPEVLELRFG